MSWFLLVAIIVGGAVWFSSSLIAVESAAAKGRVVFEKGHIVLTGLELAKADQDAMNRILDHYSKALYRIDSYEKGKLKKSQGTMTNMVTDKRLASEIASNVKTVGFTHFAVQICAGATTNPATSLNPGSTTNPATSTNSATSANPGTTTNPATSNSTSPTPGTTTNPATSTNNASNDPKCRELVDRLKPILEKYRRK